MFSAFRVGPADADCVTSIGYNSELLNHVSKIGKSWQDEIRPNITYILYKSNGKTQIIAICSSC